MRRLVCACVVRKPPKSGFLATRPLLYYIYVFDVFKDPLAGEYKFSAPQLVMKVKSPPQITGEKIGTIGDTHYISMGREIPVKGDLFSLSVRNGGIFHHCKSGIQGFKRPT